MDYTVHGVAKGWTWLSAFHSDTHTHTRTHTHGLIFHSWLFKGVKFTKIDEGKINKAMNNSNCFLAM